MKKKGINPMMIGAAVMAVVAIFLVYYMLENQRQQAAAERAAAIDQIRKEMESKMGTDQKIEIVDQVDTRNAVFSTQEIPANAPIEPVFLEIKQVPVDLHPNAYEDLSEVEGRFARRTISANEVLTPDNVAKTFQRMSNRLAPGMRAITLPITVSQANLQALDATGGFATDGDRVDLLLTYQDPSTGGLVTRTIMQNLKILYIPAPDNYRTDQTTGVTPNNRPEVSVTTTFEVTSEQAEFLFALANLGKMNMVLRNRNDDVAIRTQGADVQQILSNPGSVQQQVERSRRRAEGVGTQIKAKFPEDSTDTQKQDTNEPTIITP